METVITNRRNSLFNRSRICEIVGLKGYCDFVASFSAKIATEHTPLLVQKMSLE